MARGGGGGQRGVCDRISRAWPHGASTENGNTRLLSNFPAEQTFGAETLPMAIVFLSYLTSTVPKDVPTPHSPGSP